LLRGHLLPVDLPVGSFHAHADGTLHLQFDAGGQLSVDANDLADHPLLVRDDVLAAIAYAAVHMSHAVFRVA
jgi:hypothetical protein